MKKSLTKAFAAVLAATSILGFAACGEPSKNPSPSGKTDETVYLMPIADPATISPALGYDYYLAAEPLASLKVKMTANTAQPLHIVADLQKLYGGDQGYPQAVLVAKNSFIAANTSWVDAFMSDMADAASWLTAETTEISTVVSAISAHLTEGLTPTLKEANLTKDVIKNSSVRFTSAADGKAEVNAFLQELIGVSADAAKTVSDGFFYSGASSDAGEASVADVQAKIYMPDGAPALSMAKFMSENRAGCDFNVVDASTIASYVTGEEPKADLCVLPLNAASKLLGTGAKYQMLGTVTHGNLYLLSTDNGAKIESAQDLKALAGKSVGTIQINNVPGLTLKLLLKKNNIEYTEGEKKN